jgi:superfamily II DNA/RNA helicase
MNGGVKNQKEILEKLGIEELNSMQKEAQLAIHSQSEVILLSPTGTGKTLAFLLPIVQELEFDCKEVQALILVPSRELAIQIEQVTREMGSGFKANSVYGGQAVSKDKLNLKHPPAILIGTPGRVADHLRRGTIAKEFIKTLVLDEFDKSLEVGFEEEMKEILSFLPALSKKILTSATQKVEVPAFVEIESPVKLDFLSNKASKLELKTVVSPNRDKLKTLVETLSHIGDEPGIIFCNFRESIERVSDYLKEHQISHAYFHGGMEQKDRERALIQFRNGSHQLLLATDLAARGIDIPEIRFIIHYHLPNSEAEFTHRNGRTARMNRDGVAYILKWEQEELPEFLGKPSFEKLNPSPLPKPSTWQTVFISGGRKDKISKGDIAGLFFRQGQLKNNQLGVIEIKHDCAFAAVYKPQVQKLIQNTDNTRLKKKKVRVYKI